MNSGRLVFSQLMDLLPYHEFDKCVDRYHGNHGIRKFSCMDQFLCMAFAQITSRESLRDVETCLRALQPKLYHAGIRSKVSKSTLAEANEKRSWRIYADFAQVLIHYARKLYANDDCGVDLDQVAYAFDSTTIDLCLTLFPWARFRKCKAAIKMHTLIDLRGNIPCFIQITDGKTHDVQVLDDLPYEPGAFYIMDRGYIDYTRLYTITKNPSFFISRAKSNMDYRRHSHRPVDRSTGLRSDQTILLQGRQARKQYPDTLRRVSYFDTVHQKRLVFLTNNFVLPALIIAQLYKCRWQVELFFKWIKQNLRIKSFLGTSENAVKTQIWIAISVYVLVAILKKQLPADRNISELLQILSISLFEKDHILEVVTGNRQKNQKIDSCKQLTLFDL